MAGIVGIEYALPEAVLENEELAASYQTWTAKKIFDKTGIQTRHISADEETAADLGAAAAEKLFSAGVCKKEDIDFLLLVTQTPDYILPTSACILQNRLGLRKNIGAYDINLGCSGYIYGLATAKSLIGAGLARNVLLITAETYSKHINPMDRSTRTIFGDGAAATVIGNGGIQIGEFDLGTDGSGSGLLRIPAGGARQKKNAETSVEYKSEGNIRSLENLFMDGTGIFEFTLREVPKSVICALKRENLRLGDVDLFIFHQANQYMLNYLRRTMKIEEDKFYINMADTGNTVSASIPIALKRAWNEKKIKKNQTIVLCGFGVGLSWGTAILHTEE